MRRLRAEGEGIAHGTQSPSFCVKSVNYHPGLYPCFLIWRVLSYDGWPCDDISLGGRSAAVGLSMLSHWDARKSHMVA